MANPFELRKSYSFSTLSPEILGENYSNLKVETTTTAETAQLYNSDIYNQYETLKNVIPNLPEISQCTFIIFKNSTGSKFVIALEYIDLTSIKLVQNTNLRIIIPDTSTESASTINLRLRELGYKNFTIEEF